MSREGRLNLDTFEDVDAALGKWLKAGASRMSQVESGPLLGFVATLSERGRIVARDRAPSPSDALARALRRVEAEETDDGRRVASPHA